MIDEETLREIGRLMPSGTYIIFDEIYDNVPFCKTTPIVKLLFEDKAFDHMNVIVTNAFSKGYRMYARRLGWLIAPDHIGSAITPIQHHTRLTVDPVVQFGGIEALKNQEEFEALRQDHLHRWNYTAEAFKNLDNVRLIESKSGFYCSIDCWEFIKKNDFNNCLNLAMDILEKALVATVPGNDIGIPGTL